MECCRRVEVMTYSLFHLPLRTHFIHESLSFRALNLPFLQILPAVAFLFFPRTDYTDSPDCLLTLLSLSVFTFYFFCFLLVLSVPCGRLSLS